MTWQCLPQMVLAAVMVMVLGCAATFHDSPANPPASISVHQGDASMFVPGTIPAAHITDNPVGSGPGFGLTKAN